MRRAQRALEYRTPQLTARRRGRFDVVVCLRTDNTVLYDRLQARGYSESKIRGNVECEIFQTLVEEAKDSYDESIVKVCASDTIDDMEENEKAIVEFIGAWKSPV